MFYSPPQVSSKAPLEVVIRAIHNILLMNIHRYISCEEMPIESVSGHVRAQIALLL